jgi:hypothetical protein
MKKRIAHKGKMRNLYRNFVGNFDGKKLNYLVHLFVNGSIMLKWLLKKLGMMMWLDSTS